MAINLIPHPCVFELLKSGHGRFCCASSLPLQTFVAALRNLKVSPVAFTPPEASFFRSQGETIISQIFRFGCNEAALSLLPLFFFITAIFTLHDHLDQLEKDAGLT
jgi:hypothetical protein